MSKHINMEPHEMGRYAFRSSTDLWAFIFFMFYVIGMGELIFIVCMGSYPEAVLRGVDYNGDVCGSMPSTQINMSLSEWKARRFLWYPFVLNTSTNEIFSGASKIPICVKQCPLIGDSVSTYGGSIDSLLSFAVEFNSSEYFWRCVPRVETFQCGNKSSCETQKDLMRSLISTALHLRSFFFAVLRGLTKNWLMLLTMFVVNIILCLLWVYFMRRMVKPVIGFVIVSFVTLAMALASVAIWQFQTILSTSRYAWLSGGILLFLVAFILMCIVFYLRRDILLTCSIIGEASGVVAQVPSMLCVPLLSSVILAAVWVLFLFAIILLYTHRTTSEVTISWSGKIIRVKPMNEAEEWTIAGHFYSVFFFLWSTAFIRAFGTISLALTVTQWYWSEPGNVKFIPSDAVRWSISKTIRYHLGTVSLGSLLLATLSFLRWPLRFVEKWIHDSLDERVSCFPFCCFRCCIVCFETLVQFLTENAFIVTAMTGEPLISAAKHAAKTLLHNSTILSVSVLSDVFLFAVKGLMMLEVTLLGFLWLYKTNENIEADTWATIFCLAVLTYFVTSLFTGVFNVSIETMLLSFCHDCATSNGEDRPLFAPFSLKEHFRASYAQSQFFSPRSSASHEDCLIQNDGYVLYA